MQQDNWHIAGIDYGSKLAGTTVIAHLQDSRIEFIKSEKKKDADALLLQWTKKKIPTHIFLDAPLSLPGVYLQLPECTDYFYRRADKDLRAMSPMFLGGLTARAMKLKAQLEALGIEILEVYPAQMANGLSLKNKGYKKQVSLLPEMVEYLAPPLEGFKWQPDDVVSWHHFDALLALISGIRFMQNHHDAFGDETEGLIIV